MPAPDWLEAANNVESTLAYDLTYGQTTLTVQAADAASFPSLYPYRLTVWDFYAGADPGQDTGMEIVECTDRAGAVLTVVRGKELTSPVAHSAGEKVQLCVTAGLIQQLQEQIDALWAIVDAL